MSETDKVCVAVGLGGPEDLRVYWRSVEKRGWNEAIEAAAELMEKQTDFPGSGDEWEHSAAAIRKLKKP